MTKLPVGMAIKLTETNAQAVALVNSGIVPKVDDSLKRGEYFIFPYDPEATQSIMPGYVFEANWKAYTDAQPVNEKYFVEIVEI